MLEKSIGAMEINECELRDNSNFKWAMIEHIINTAIAG